METQIQKGAIEAIIFASGEPIPLEKIAAAMELGKTEAKALVATVMEEFNQMHSGIQIIQINDSYQMCTKAEFESYIRLALEKITHRCLQQHWKYWLSLHTTSR